MAKPLQDGITYEPAVFAQRDIDSAKWVILTPAPDLTVEQRWELETPWTVDRLVFPDGPSLILDWGCGIGRLAKPLMDKGHHLVGVDISTNMLSHAFGQAGARHFAGIPPSIFRRIARPAAFDGGYASWSLQHVRDPERDIDTIAEVLKPGASFYLLNSRRRFIPVKGHPSAPDKLRWIDDGIDVLALMEKHFDLQEGYEVASFIPDNSYLHRYRRKG
jgi:SAM-dependent methyltransferase